ncbi:MAG: deoxyribonuclease IV [Bryobacteraceae bacterium]|nr:deoxyribonuclease IV [Bryobacteraceae bacterium]
MRIGIHTSSAGALENSALEAMRLGANTFQIFSASPRMWRAGSVSPASAAALRRLREANDLYPLVIHDSYLINLGSPDPVIRPKSIAAFRGEIERALAIGAEYLVFHPGSGKDHSREAAIAAVAAGLSEAARGLSGSLKLLIENTAGQGSVLGSTLEELAEIRNQAQAGLDFELGYCLDTCHSFAAGYDVASETGLELFLQGAEAILGLERVAVIHANDSKGGLGSHLDRHEHIGEGLIGKDAFARLLWHPQMQTKAFILETPVDDEGDQSRDLNTLKELCRKSPTVRKTSK